MFSMTIKMELASTDPYVVYPVLHVTFWIEDTEITFSHSPGTNFSL